MDKLSLHQKGTHKNTLTEGGRRLEDSPHNRVVYTRVPKSASARKVELTPAARHKRGCGYTLQTHRRPHPAHTANSSQRKRPVLEGLHHIKHKRSLLLQ